MCKRRGNQADCKCAPDAIDDAGGHIDDHAGNDDRPDLHHLQKCHVQNAGEGHVAAQVRFQRLLIAAAPEDAEALLRELRGAVPSAQRIGVVEAYQGGPRISLR